MPGPPASFHLAECPYYPLLLINHSERFGVAFSGPVDFPGGMFNGSQSMAFPERYLAINDPMAGYPGLALTNEATFMNRCGQIGDHNGPMMAPGGTVLQGCLHPARPFCKPMCDLSGPAFPSAVVAPSRSMIGVPGPITPHLIWPNNAPMCPLSGPLCTPPAALTLHPLIKQPLTYPACQVAASSEMTVSSGPVYSSPGEVFIHTLQGVMNPLPLFRQSVANQINTSPGGSAHDSTVILPRYRRRAREQEQDDQGSPNKPAKRRRSEFEPPKNPDTTTLVLNLNNTLESGPLPQQTQDGVHVVSVSVNIDTSPPNIPSPQ